LELRNGGSQSSVNSATKGQQYSGNSSRGGRGGGGNGGCNGGGRGGRGGFGRGSGGATASNRGCSARSAARKGTPPLATSNVLTTTTTGLHRSKHLQLWPAMVWIQTGTWIPVRLTTSRVN
jgi:hypothetical protein